MNPKYFRTGCCETEVACTETEVTANVPANEFVELVAAKATLDAVKRYALVCETKGYVDRAVLMAILGMEPDAPAEPAL